ncbi:protein amnionless [Drosophila busckii]|uniref:protein amnionless n=1 Tax=Drosophila busckii TaxID=30019 RepID=UPI00083EA2AC|nr:protein amnionless [Drosophila busckii]
MWQVKLITVIILLLELETETEAIKWHGAGADFYNTAAWLNYIPCAKDLVVFPAYYPAVLPLPPALSVGGFKLPRQGALLLAEDAQINLGAASQSCEHERGQAYLQPAQVSKWFDPRSWSSTPTTINAPELERVPCDDDHVIINANNGPIAFDLENVQFLRLGQLILAGASLSKQYLQELLQRELGQLLFQNAAAVSVEYYRGQLCGCHKDYERLLEPVCHNVETRCPVPHCVSPLRPLGSCCFVCGATLTLPSEHCLAEERQQLLKFIQQEMKQQQLEQQLQFHVDYVGSAQYGNHLQLIITDRDGYSERSVQFMHHLVAQRNHSTLLHGQAQLQLKFAGRPYNPNVSFFSVLLMLFCLVLVCVVAVIMLAHFMPQHPYLNRIPQWIHDPRRWRWRHLGIRLRRNLLFNRFDNAGAAAAANSAVGRLGVIGYAADRDELEVRERSFDNPMFEQEPATAATSEAPTKSPLDLLPANVEVGDLDSCSAEEQELTEINLESSESESDAEAETKE